jgi:hypothetical protein
MDWSSLKCGCVRGRMGAHAGMDFACMPTVFMEGVCRLEVHGTDLFFLIASQVK